MDKDLLTLFTKGNSNYDRILQFKIVSIFVVIITIFSKLFDSMETTTYIIILLTFGLYITSLFLNTIDNDLNDSNKIIFFKIESLQEKVYKFLLYKINHTTVNNNKLTSTKQQELFEKNKLDSLYIDSQLIIFLYSIIKLYDYNQYEFYSLLKGTNNILKLHNEILTFYESNKDYPENISEILEIAIQLKVNCMNILQNFIYSIPKSKIFYDYIDTSLNTFEFLINKHIKDMHKFQKKNINSKGININTKFFHLNMPKGYDQFSNHKIIPSKNHDSLIDLYI